MFLSRSHTCIIGVLLLLAVTFPSSQCVFYIDLCQPEEHVVEGERLGVLFFNNSIVGFDSCKCTFCDINKDSEKGVNLTIQELKYSYADQRLVYHYPHGAMIANATHSNNNSIGEPTFFSLYTKCADINITLKAKPAHVSINVNFGDQRENMTFACSTYGYLAISDGDMSLQASSSDSKKHESSRGLAIGLGTGIPVLVIALVGCIYIMCRKGSETDSEVGDSKPNLHRDLDVTTIHRRPIEEPNDDNYCYPERFTNPGYEAEWSPDDEIQVVTVPKQYSSIVQSDLPEPPNTTGYDNSAFTSDENPESSAHYHTLEIPTDSTEESENTENIERYHTIDGTAFERKLVGPPPPPILESNDHVYEEVGGFKSNITQSETMPEMNQERVTPHDFLDVVNDYIADGNDSDRCRKVTEL